MKEKLKKKINVGALSVRNTKKNLPNCAPNGNKGITLVALIITIIVLLILAVVTIQAVSKDGIIAHAKNAQTEYQQAQAEEKDMLEYYESYLEGTVGAWTQEGNIVKRANSDGTITQLQIGEKVNYDELSNGTKTHPIEYTQNGGTSSSNNQTLTTENLEWRVLGVNKKGELELISTKPTSSTVYLRGETGWLNAETILDTTCDELYGKGEGASSARSLKVEDVNKLGNYTPTLTTWYRYKYDATANHLQYSTSNNYNSETKEGTWTEYENTTNDCTTFKEPGKDTISSTNYQDAEGKTIVAELQYTYYSYTVSSKVPSTLTTPEGILMSDLLTKGLNSTNDGANDLPITQWLSSRCVGCYASYAFFFVRFLNGDGSIIGFDVWGSGGGTGSPSYAVRPVVSLKSDVPMAKNNEGVWSVPQSQGANQ